jgi:subtilisin family serine protease
LHAKSHTDISDPDHGKIKVAVIDTGLDESLLNKDYLCKTGHKDFTGTSLVDRSGHGTHISGLIDQNVKDMFIENGETVPNILAKKVNYCQIILKFYDPLSHENIGPTIQSLRYAIELKVDYINYSAGGNSFSMEEKKLIKKALDLGIKVIVAAGNDGLDLSVYSYYPANHDSRLVVVGNMKNAREHNISSNYGPNVKVWEIGTNRVSFGLNGGMSRMTGTSQATAIHTGKMIRKSLLGY